MSISDLLKSLYDNLVLAVTTCNEFTQALPDCYDAVGTKGGTIPQEQTAGNLPDAIESIPNGTIPDADIYMYNVYGGGGTSRGILIYELDTQKMNAIGLPSGTRQIYNGKFQQTRVSASIDYPRVTTLVDMYVDGVFTPANTIIINSVPSNPQDIVSPYKIKFIN